jgi:peroxiredoxin Q/BCP
MTLHPGDQAPAFTLSDQDGNTFSLADALELDQVWRVVYFYPKDDTPGCTAESCSFRDSFESFTDIGATVIGISSDSVESHKAFATKNQLPFTLLADPKGQVRKAWGVKKTLGLLPGRVTFVLDPEGVVRHVFSSQMKPTAHIEEALGVIRAGSSD